MQPQCRVSYKYIQSTHYAQPKYHADPEHDIIEQRPAPHKLRSLDRNDGQLCHLRQEPVSPEFLRDTAHHELMPKRTHEESDQRRHIFADMHAARAVNMTSQEVMDGDVPFSRKLQPVAAIPPIRVEMAVREASDLRKSPEHILEYDEEDKQEHEHEGEKEHTACFRKDKPLF